LLGDTAHVDVPAAKTHGPLTEGLKGQLATGDAVFDGTIADVHHYETIACEAGKEARLAPHDTVLGTGTDSLIEAPISPEHFAPNPEVTSVRMDETFVGAIGGAKIVCGEGHLANPGYFSPGGDVVDRPTYLDSSAEDVVVRPALRGGNDLLNPVAVRRDIVVGEDYEFAEGVLAKGQI
jgi:hypothetical protein